MKRTLNYNLLKPDQTDFYNVDDFNGNADTIDAELKRLSDAIGNGGAGNDILTRLNNLEKYVGDLTNLGTTQKANLVAAINEVRQNLIDHMLDNRAHLFVKGYFNGDIDGLKSNALYLVTTGSINTPFEGNGNLLVLETGTGAVMQFYNPLHSSDSYFRTYDGVGWTSWVLHLKSTDLTIGRVGLHCSQISDWNNALENGWYMGTRTHNSPVDNPEADTWFMGEVISHNQLYVIQKVYQFTDPNRTTYVRSKLNGVWTAWREESWITLFTSVSNGKATVNQAVTDMGIYTAPDATFETTATNIRKLGNSITGSGTLVRNGASVRVSGTTPNMIPSVIVVLYSNTANRGRTVYWQGVGNPDIVSYMLDGSTTMKEYSCTLNVWNGGFTIDIAHPVASGAYQFIAFK
ncbi:pyocin knob domain-containing protein [Lysinibacillus sp. KU-BSD001]|uniref:pyocin knob domain-containing protein n=1 Tax=Lysinibacillus sp. KU-BSD001 TaxID=3141328 RepID=UPI0036F04E6A